MGLTDVEKSAGRRFRDERELALQELNVKDPPDDPVPFYLGHYRHLCPARKHKSKAIELKECYVLSPIYPDEGVQAGRFAYIYREGKCLNCGRSARSEKGLLVDGRLRPPLTGRVARS